MPGIAAAAEFAGKQILGEVVSTESVDRGVSKWGAIILSATPIPIPPMFQKIVQLGIFITLLIVLIHNYQWSGWNAFLVAYGVQFAVSFPMYYYSLYAGMKILPFLL